MLILLSPAKTLDFETPARTKKVSEPGMLQESQKLVTKLRSYKPKKLSELMSISDNLAQLNVQRFQEWQMPFPEEQARPCIQAFRGDVYVGLDADTLKLKDVQHAQKHIRILSGLYGVLKPLDNILAYRLEMGTSLKTRRGKNLYEFWGSRVTDSLNSELEQFSQPLVINLASNEYSKVVQQKNLLAPTVTPVFKDEKNGQYKVISFFAKKARGAMARHLVEKRSYTSDDIMSFDSMGYRFSEHDSSEGQPVFLRTAEAAQQHA